MQENSEDRGKEHWKGFEDAMPNTPPDLELLLVLTTSFQNLLILRALAGWSTQMGLSLGKIRWRLARVMRIGPAPPGQPGPVPETSPRLGEL